MLSFPIERLFFEPNEIELDKDSTLPRTDLVETEKNIIVSAELPGVPKENIEVELNPGNILSIKAERKTEEKKKGDKWHIQERSYSKFRRSFKMPRDIDPNSIKACYHGGVLKVIVNKKAVSKEPAKKILIQ